MNFSTSISTCLAKYATFKGRATRSEYWWFYLFTVLLSWGSIIVERASGIWGDGALNMLVILVFLLPTIAVGSRRLHDTGKSGWWQLLFFTIIGIIPLIIWLARDTKKETNKYGDYVPVGQV